MTLYSLDAIQQLSDFYKEKGGVTNVIKEGVLMDDLIMYGDGLKTTVCKVVPLNEWSSAYKVRMYNKCPKKYEKFII